MNREYGKWIGEMNWDYFITVRKNYNFTKKAVRRIMDKIEKGIKNSKYVERVFIVGERDLVDWNNYHLHLLINTNSNQDFNIQSEINSYFGIKDTKHIETVIDNKSVGIYLSKFLDKDIEYDIYFNTTTL